MVFFNLPPSLVGQVLASSPRTVWLCQLHLLDTAYREYWPREKVFSSLSLLLPLGGESVEINFM